LVERVAFSLDGKLVAARARSGAVRVWDVATGAEQKCGADCGGPLVFSPDGLLLATAAREGSVRLHDAVTGKELVRLAGHLAPVRAIAFSPDGRRLYTGSDDTTTLAWDLTRFQQPRR
jgi:WD40 repeat protein